VKPYFGLGSTSVHPFFAIPRTLTVKGDSMTPYLLHGQEISVSPYGKLLVPGRCYLFYYQGKHVLHRLVFYTRRQAFFLSDNGVWVEKVAREMIFAKLDRAGDVLVVNLIAATNLIYCVLVKLGLYSDNLGTIRKRWLALWLKGRKQV
jgi:Peptidase S24-like